jgi:hypothetical protein
MRRQMPRMLRRLAHEFDHLSRGLMTQRSAIPWPLPFEFAGGVAVLTQGQVNYFTVDLVPGNDLLFCVVPDVKDGKSHVQHGMVRHLRID